MSLRLNKTFIRNICQSILKSMHLLYVSNKINYIQRENVKDILICNFCGKYFTFLNENFYFLNNWNNDEMKKKGNKKFNKSNIFNEVCLLIYYMIDINIQESNVNKIDISEFLSNQHSIKKWNLLINSISNKFLWHEKKYWSVFISFISWIHFDFFWS